MQEIYHTFKNLKPKQNKSMLTTTQKAKQMGVSRERVRQFIQQKRFHPMPIQAGKFWLFTGNEKIEIKKRGRPFKKKA